MIYPTGDVAQTDHVTVTLTVAFKLDDKANDWLLSALIGQIVYLTNTYAWRDQGYVITAAEAAAAAEAMLASMVIME